MDGYKLNKRFVIFATDQLVKPFNQTMKCFIENTGGFYCGLLAENCRNCFKRPKKISPVFNKLHREQ